MSQNIYLIGADYVNGISIYQSLKDLKAEGKIILFNTSGRNMAGKLFPELKVIDGITDGSKLLVYLNSLDADANKFLFLTHEKYHSILWENREQLRDQKVFFHIGNKNPELILNKKKFLNLIKEQTQVEVPHSYDISNKEKIDYPIFAKPISTFLGTQKVSLPKKVIHNQNELNDYIALAQKLELKLEDIEIQELLSTKTKDNVSISGWYEKGFHSFFQTQKILQHPPKRGNGDVVGCMELEPDLEKQVLEIMKVLDYKGPFEAEFVKERKGSQYKLIEINPRFWMQHGLIEQLSGHLLVARYIGKDAIKPNTSYRYWMYTAIVPIQLAKFRFNYIPYLFRKDVYKPISFSQALKFLVKYSLQIISKK